MKLPTILSLAAFLSLASCAKSPKAQAAEDQAELVSSLQTYHRLYGRYPSNIPRNWKKPKPPKGPPNALDIAVMAALLGKNGETTVVYKVKPKRLDADGVLIDPWGTAYKFEAPDRKVMVVRSAGPDKSFGTPDDVVKGTQ